MANQEWSDQQLIELFASVNNAGRWGSDDQLGTLNYINDEKRKTAAGLVKTGRSVSLAHPLPEIGKETGRPPKFDHKMHYARSPMATASEDHIALDVHQPGLTHVDCLSHLASYDGRVYNNRRFDDVALETGLAHGSVFAQRQGIISRGVLLDFPAVFGVESLEPGHRLSAEDFDKAEKHAGVRVSTGDVLVVRVGAAQISKGGGKLRPGPGPDAIRWMHQHEIALYTGDAADYISEVASKVLFSSERPPDPPPTLFPLPLHQIGIPAMGLVLLDGAAVEELAAVCKELGRYEFMFFAAPLAIPGGTGSPVNPIALF